MENALSVLNKYYGYKEFRNGQHEIINNILNKKDVLAVMPTGAGKSICYQIPALMFEGTTIVISPLISLMKDQVDGLRIQGIDVVYINSLLSKYEYEEILFNIKNNKYKIIYVAPERLDSIEFKNIIDNINISQVAIDEAHCVSEWGHDFRSSYKRIPDFIKDLKNRPVVSAFTATASKEVRTDIINLLKLNEPIVSVLGFNRDNLELTIVKEGRKDRYLKEYINKNKEVSGIIYCSTRKEVERLYDALKSEGYDVAKYHGGMNDLLRLENQDAFIKDKVNIIIATNAFGMGINKSNVRYVIHYNMPQNIESYYQEIGRAGRDGEKSHCILLFTPGDVNLQKYLIDMSISSNQRKIIAYEKLKEMTNYVYTNMCLKKYILNYFGEESEGNCNNCSNCLNTGDEVDKTIDAQKVLSCIYKMKKPYGINLIVKVLRGSKDKRINSLKFNELSTYGIMKEYSEKDLITFINVLISNGFINQIQGEYPVIKLNNNSIKVLKSEIEVKLKVMNEVESKYETNSLFEVLRKLRYDIALKEKVPPYLIFGDEVIKEISKIKPKNKEELMDINGISSEKYKKYGKKLLETIKEYDISSENKDIELGNYYVNTDLDLYNILRQYRKIQGEKENKIPYTILSKNTLQEISGRYPMTEEELMDISGLGKIKISKYGKDLINIVKSYVEEKNIKPQWHVKGRSHLIIDGEGRKKDIIVMEMLNNGIDIKTISENLELSISTILGYVTNYLDENSLDLSLNLDQYINSDYEEEILDLCNELGIDKVSLIKKRLPNIVTYESIRAVILKYFYKLT
ncbi:MAG: DNA helicase RecQ [Clostridiales bacterium]|nr:DNA helicase RecQ [Clostridiales bacterium]